MTEAITYHAIDKSGWGDGPWQHEPDAMLWEHAGLPCLIMRSQLGALSGYVGVPTSHVWHGWDYDHVEVVVHGGLTFSDVVVTPIGHAFPNHWWFGFDCMQLGDYCPAMSVVEVPVALTHLMCQGSYRELAYVQQVTEHLATQLADQPRWGMLRAYVAALAVLALGLGWLVSFVHEVTQR